MAAGREYAPQVCYVGKGDERFFQYTMLEERSQQREIHLYLQGTSGYSTVEFVKRTILHFGYSPKTIQTDNGTEFCNGQNIHIFDFLCAESHITAQTDSAQNALAQWQSGTQTSQRSGVFLQLLVLLLIREVQLQMKNYLRHSNRIPMSVLGWKSPIQRRKELLPPLLDTLLV